MKEQNEGPLQRSIILVHGPPKVGKTTLAASFPKPNLFIATEPGHKFVDPTIKKSILRLKRGEDGISSGGTDYVFRNGWEKLIWFLEESNILKKKKPKTITVDTIGPLYEMCMDYVGMVQGFEHPGDAGHGKGWNALGREFTKGLGLLVEAAEDIGATVLFIAHSNQYTLQAGDREYPRIEVALTGHARKILLPNPDHIWYLGYHSNAEDSMKAFEKNRALWLQGTPVVEAGGRDVGLSEKLKFISPFPRDNQYSYILEKVRKSNG